MKRSACCIRGVSEAWFEGLHGADSVHGSLASLLGGAEAEAEAGCEA